MSIVVTPASAPSYWFMSIRAAILSRAPVTMELVLPPGGFTPLHQHDDDEDSGLLVEGSLKIWCDGEITDVSAGSWISLPRGRPHAQLATGTSPARILAVYSNTHFADFVQELGIPTSQPQPPMGPPPASEIPRIREMATRHNLQVLGPPPPELLAARR
jgi:uncharacterized RmlC-like cupin family protein